MPEKDPNTIVFLWSLIPDQIRSAMLAILVAFLRIMYDNKEPQFTRRMLECFLCGAIALCVASLIKALGLNADFGTFAGGSIGLLGAEHARSLARRFTRRQVDKL